MKMLQVHRTSLTGPGSEWADLREASALEVMMSGQARGGQIWLDSDDRPYYGLMARRNSDRLVRVVEGEYTGPDVHVDWHMTPDEYRQLRAVLLSRAAQQHPYIQRLTREGKLPDDRQGRDAGH